MPRPAETFPRALIALDDNQLAALMAAATPLQPADRGPFLETVAANLRALPAVGPGSLHRIVRQAQREFLRGRGALDGTGWM